MQDMNPHVNMHDKSLCNTSSGLIVSDPGKI